MINSGSVSIYDAMMKIKEGHYAIPPFQREYQWSKEKIVKLWDSILVGYPISTFLFWKYSAEIVGNASFLRFTSSAKFRSSGKTIGDARFSAAKNKIEEGVLDGQQRLTSLYLSLVGNCSLLRIHQRQEDDGEPIDIYINLQKEVVQNVDEEGFEEIENFDLKFSSRELRLPFFKLRNIMSDSFKNPETRADEINNTISNLAESHRSEAKNILNTLCTRVYDDKLIQFQEADGEESEALEMFIRFNNGGKPLTKADIADATITHYWEDASESFKTVVKYKGNLDKVDADLQEFKFFGLNFITRLGAMLYEDNVAANLGAKIIRGLRDNWTGIKKSLVLTNKLLKDIGRINIETYQSRWNVLLPIIYFVYANRNPNASDEANLNQLRLYKDSILAYLARATLFRYFQNGTTAKLTKLKKLMNEHQVQGKPVLDLALLEEIPELKVTGPKIDDVLESKKGTPIAKIALEWVNFTGTLGTSIGAHEDHLQPYSLFNGRIPQDGVSEETWKHWQSCRDMVPNLQFFDGELNRYKSNSELYEFYESLADGENGKQDYEKNYLLFPIESEDEKNLLLRANFGQFFEKRRAVMKEKLAVLLGLEL